jgi:hypothetical protein|tara:strand:+ start:102 stop:377 length:276 start_codon:yes stop_codon:yes gene_type:complete
MKSYKTSLILALKEHILSGQPITSMEAITLFGVPVLTAEIARMRQGGYKIDSRKIPFVKVVRRINEYAVYVPPSNLPIKEITVTEYVWAGL